MYCVKLRKTVTFLTPDKGKWVILINKDDCIDSLSKILDDSAN